MELILDTCGLLSLAGMAERSLSADCLKRIQDAGDVGICACSAFEIAIKHKKGQLDLNPYSTAGEFWRLCIRHYRLTVLPVTDERFLKAVSLPDHHADPFDRLIIEAALGDKIPVVTYDRLFPPYGVTLLN